MLGYLPVQTSTRARNLTSYCKTFDAWRCGDDTALDKLLAQGYERLFLPKAERLAKTLPHGSHQANRLLARAWVTIGQQHERTQLQSFSQFLIHFQDQLEQVAATAHS